MNKKDTQLLVENWRNYIFEEKESSSISRKAQISKGIHSIGKEMQEICRNLSNKKFVLEEYIDKIKEEGGTGIINKINVNKEKISNNNESLAIAAMCLDRSLSNEINEYLKSGIETVLSMIVVEHYEDIGQDNKVNLESLYTRKSLSSLGEKYLRYKDMFMNTKWDEKKGLIKAARNKVVLGTILLFLEDDNIRNLIERLSPKVYIKRAIEIFDKESYSK